MIKGLTLGDLHFGIKDSKRLYSELDQFKNYLKSQENLDIVVLMGDYFDCKLSVGDSSTYYAISFFQELIQLVKERNISLRMLQGTRSHDLNQLQIFKPYELEPGLDFKIIETVSEEDFKGIKILYIPEEYPENCVEYYAEYKKRKYDVMFSHTTFDFVAQPGQIENSLKDIHSAPVMIWKEWKDALKDGFVISGHIHGRNTYGKKIYYPGSFTRWTFGERSEKGFTKFEIDPETHKYLVSYIDNVDAPKFEVFSVKELEIDLSNITAVDLQEAFKKFITNDTDHWRIDLSGLSPDNIEILKKYYADNPNIKIEVRESSGMLKVLDESKHEEEFKKYHYITKRQLPINKMVQKYCDDELGIKISLENIDKILKETNEE